MGDEGEAATEQNKESAARGGVERWWRDKANRVAEGKDRGQDESDALECECVRG